MLVFRENQPNVWFIEYYSQESAGRRLYGLGIVTDASGTPTFEYVEVVPEHRNEGIGTAILKSCLAKWPGLVLSSGWSEDIGFMNWFQQRQQVVGQ